MFKRLTTFLHDETGAINVDWLMLLAGLVMLGMNAVMMSKVGAVELAGEMGKDIHVVKND